MKVVLAGGGTAGHVFPAIALADRLTADGDDVVFIGSEDGQEAALVPEAGYAFHPIRAQRMVRALSPATLRAPFVALRSVGDCGPLVRGADAVVGLGGYVSAPAVLAGRRAGVPVVLHEQNAVPGLANRLLSRAARAVGVSFADAVARFPDRVRTVATGNPVREPIRLVPANREALAAEARDVLHLEAERMTIVVFGGSLGALHLDQIVAGAVAHLRDRADLQLLVLSGPSHLDVVEPAARDSGDLLVRVLPFLDRIDLALAIADAAVSRAGAGHIAELTVCGIASILVPYPHATENHQEANAREIVRAGAAELYPDQAMSPEGLAGRILGLVDDEPRRMRMRAAALAWARPDADERLAALVREVADS